MSRFIIKDWANNICFFGQTFESFDDADCFLTQFIEKVEPRTIDDEKLYSDIRGDYFICEKD